MIKKVEEIQTPITVIKAQLMKHGLTLTNYGVANGSAYGANTNKSLESCIQQLIDLGTIQIIHHDKKEKKKKWKTMALIYIPYEASHVKIPITPLVIHFPAPFFI